MPHPHPRSHYRIEITPSAQRTLRKLDRAIRRRIVAAIDGLAEEPRPHGVVKMRGDDNLWRVRVGDYRIVYEIHDSRLVVLVIKIGHRREVYER